MKYNFENIPGYAYHDEAEIIYDLIKKTPTTKILEVGCANGKLTTGIAAMFPTHTITGIDIWDAHLTGYKDPMFIPGNRWTNENYIGLVPSMEVCKQFTAEYSNINISMCNFLNFSDRYDLILLSIDGVLLDWDKILSHAISLCNIKIIGRHAHFHVEKRNNMKKSFMNFDINYHTHGVYSIDVLKKPSSTYV